MSMQPSTSPTHSQAIEKYELEIKRRNDEIEKKTREIDLLNRKCVVLSTRAAPGILSIITTSAQGLQCMCLCSWTYSCFVSG